MDNAALLKSIRRLVMLFGALLIVTIAVAGTNIYLTLAAPPRSVFSPISVSFEGYLENSNGNAMSGVHSLTFHVYDVESGYVDDLDHIKWSGTYNVDVAQGLYTVQLGTTENPLGADTFNGLSWLSVAVDGGDEMSPRIAISAVPWALNAVEAQTAVEAQQALGLQGYEVASTAPQNGNMLVWNSTSNKWEPKGVSGDATSLQGVQVDNATPTANQALIWNNTTGKWTASTINAPVNVQVFHGGVGQTWTRPTNVTMCQVIVYGAGGGGGGGRAAADGTNRRGGSGGGGGAYASAMFLALDLPASVNIDVGIGGASGAAGAPGGNNGTAGDAGGDSRFGTGPHGYVYAGGGGGGIGGISGTTASSGGGGGGTAGTGGPGLSGAASIGGAPQTTAGAVGYGGAGGGTALVSNGAKQSEFGGGAGGGATVSTSLCLGAGASSLKGGGGGGGGASVTSGNLVACGGGQAGRSLFWGIGNGMYGGYDGWDGNTSLGGGGGGGGITLQSSRTGQDGGNGGLAGGGGGGGGAGISAGNGGKGGDGLVVVTCW